MMYVNWNANSASNVLVFVWTATVYAAMLLLTKGIS